MNARQNQILKLLERDREISASWLSFEVGAPEASIRRDIQVLRRNGHNVAFGLNGSYRIGQSYK